MKYVVEIDDATYHRFVAGFANENDAGLIEKIFKNAEPLPERHGAIKDVELVIKISEKIYESVMNGTYCGTLYQELKNGTPVHYRLIDTDGDRSEEDG